MRIESIDTNVLLRAAIDTGDNQTMPARALLAQPDCMFSVSLTTVAESMHVMVRHYSMSREHSAASLRLALSVPSIVCQTAIVLAALDIFEAHPKLSFEDCLAAEQAGAAGATPLWTFDTKLAKQHPAAKLVV